MGRKVIATYICLAMVLSFIVIIIEIASVVEAPTTWFVDDVPGSGGPGDPPEDFTSIQDAIDASSEGDTVFVYNGTYYENVIVNKTINLTGEDKDNTIIDSNNNGDVVNITKDWVNITEFTITHGGGSEDAGILINSENNSIYENNISFNDYYGIYILGNNNYIHNNNIMYNFRGVFIEYSNFNNVQLNYLSNNTQMTIRLQYSKGNEVKKNEAKIGGITLWGSNQNNISENKCGIGLVNSSENNIIGNTGSIGLMLDSKRNNIIDNNASNLKTGISLDESDENNIINNNLSSNSEYGIDAYFSFRNNIINNSIYSNGKYGIHIDPGSVINIIDNQIYFNEVGAIRITSGSGNITKNDIKNNGHGITTFLCSSLNIYLNNISNNNVTAIRLYDSYENNIMNNMIINNTNGTHITGFISEDNKIFHNNFIENTNQSYDDNIGNYWDNGYPSGGNYWSDYSGDDYLKGPKQNIPGSDGIGDTPRIIDSNSRDNYPLMNMDRILENYTTLKQGWNLISIPFIQVEKNLTRVLGAIDSWYDAVQWFDNDDESNLWKHNRVGKSIGNDLFELNETIGFWVHITNPGDTIFLYNGTQPISNQTIPLHPGWNMVGYPSLTSYNRTQGLNNLTFGNQVDAIWSYDAATQKWEQMGEADYFQIGRGYYIHARSECEWEVPL